MTGCDSLGRVGRGGLRHFLIAVIQPLERIGHGDTGWQRGHDEK